MGDLTINGADLAPEAEGLDRNRQFDRVGVGVGRSRAGHGRGPDG